MAPGGPGRRRGPQARADPLRARPPRAAAPAVLSEGAASLLPGQVRPGLRLGHPLDADGEDVDVDVTLAMVKSVDRLDYAQVQAGIDGSTGDERFELLKEIGERRVALEQARGGASLPIPQQEVVLEDGRYRLQFRPALAGRGLERPDLAAHRHGRGRHHARRPGRASCGRCPGPDRNALARFHRQAAALGARWPAELPYGAFLRSLDRTRPAPAGHRPRGGGAVPRRGLHAVRR